MDAAFIELKKHWYEKLKDSGFEDIEYFDWSTGNVLGVNNPACQLRANYSQDVADYYYYGTHWLNELSGRRLAVWSMHMEGASHKDISDATGLTVGSVKTVLHRLRKRFRRWLCDQASQEA